MGEVPEHCAALVRSHVAKSECAAGCRMCGLHCVPVQGWSYSSASVDCFAQVPFTSMGNTVCRPGIDAVVVVVVVVVVIVVVIVVVAVCFCCCCCFLLLLL